jgi:hypothetical protein
MPNSPSLSPKALGQFGLFARLTHSRPCGARHVGTLSDNKYDRHGSFHCCSELASGQASVQATTSSKDLNAHPPCLSPTITKLPQSWSLRLPVPSLLSTRSRDLHRLRIFQRAALVPGVLLPAMAVLPSAHLAMSIRSGPSQSSREAIRITH